MKNTPPGWPRISSALFYLEPAPAIDWLCHAFGFEVRIKVAGEDGAIVHSELVYGDGLIMVAGAGAQPGRSEETWPTSPRMIHGGNTQALFMYVDDVEAHCARARAVGAKITVEPKTSDHGEEYWTDRTYQCEDLEGHRWWFGQRLRTGSPKK